MDNAITFHYQADGFKLKDAGRLKSWLAKTAGHHGLEVAGLACIFVTDEALLEMNRQHLQHDYYTDIITFDLSEGDEIEGELYISVDRVRDNARIIGVPFLVEMRRVMVHGLLHLCGLRDKTEEEIADMRLAEEEALQLYFRL